MDSENTAYLDKVFENSQNDTQTFLSTIVQFLAKKPAVAASDLQKVLSEIFGNLAKSTKTIHSAPLGEQPVLTGLAHEATTTHNGNETLDESFIAINSETSDFMPADEDDVVIPETQFFDEDTNDTHHTSDSGESVVIPLYNKALNEEINTNSTSDDESEFAFVRPESVSNHFTEPQSQLLFTSLDRSMVDDMLGANTEAHLSNPTVVQTDVSPQKTTEKQVVAANNGDRSGSSTPDIDFSANSAYKDSAQNERSVTATNDDETQHFSQDLFDAPTQQVRVPAPIEEPETEDIFGELTQQVPVFRQPAAISTPRASKSVPAPVDEPETEDILGELTQQAPVFRQPAAVSTPRATKTPKPKSPVVDDVFDAPTQVLDDADDIFNVATQQLVLDKPALAFTKETPDSSTDADDVFEADTQIFDATKSRDEVWSSNVEDNSNESDTFNALTQQIDSALTSKTLKKRFPAVATQASQAACTPEWLASKLPKEQVEQFEKEQPEREKNRIKLGKHQYLFASSDEDDDDLEYDLPALPAPVIAPKKVSRNMKRPSSEIDDEVPLKNFAVNLSRAECDKHLQEQSRPRAKKVAAEPKEAMKSADQNSNIVVEPRNLRNRKSDTNEKPSENRQSKRKALSKSNVEESLKEKRQKEVSKEKVTSQAKKARHVDESPKEKRPKETSKGKDTSRVKKTKHVEDSPKKKRQKEANKEKDTSQAKETKQTEPKTHIETHCSSFPTKPRSSTTYSILFTQTKPDPFIKVIPQLGGCIVDTPQLGNILICDKVSHTFKFLYALAKGIPIVSPRWLEKSAKYGEFQSTEPYLLNDKKAEAKYAFSLRRSLEIARRTKLLTNYHIMATPNVQPTELEIADIVGCCGGKYIGSPLSKRGQRTNAIVVLITSRKDRKLWDKYRTAYPDLQIVSGEGFMQSILQQKITFSKYFLI